MNELKKLKKSINSEPHRGRHGEIRKAAEDLEKALTWWHPMMEVLGVQAVWMLLVVSIYG